MTREIIAQDIGNGLVILSMILAVSCVVAYHVKSQGEWNRSEVGRHLMAFMTSMSAVLTVTVVKIVIVAMGNDEPQWFYDVRVLVFASVPAVLAWRLIIILTADRDKDYGHDR